ncbi:MAG: hypothetical protein ABL982_16255, partial [Vicinamibacterales bacterium]
AEQLTLVRNLPAPANELYRRSTWWRRARVAPGAELVRPLALRLEGGALFGCAGDGFHRAGGVEGAYLSGLQLAAQFLELRRAQF